MINYFGPLFSLSIVAVLACSSPADANYPSPSTPRATGDEAWDQAAYGRAVEAYEAALSGTAALSRTDSLYLLNRIVRGHLWSGRDTAGLGTTIARLQRAERDPTLDRRTRGDLAATRGQLAYARFDLAEAKQALHTALARYPAERSTDSLRIAETQALLALIYRDAGSFADSIAHYADPAVAFLLPRDRPSRALVQALLALSKDKWNQQDQEFALAYAEVAWLALRRLPERYRLLEARTQGNLAEMLYKRSRDRPDNATWTTYHLDQATAFAERSIDGVAYGDDPRTQLIWQHYVTVMSSPDALVTTLDRLDRFPPPERRFYAHPDFWWGIHWFRAGQRDSARQRLERFVAAEQPSSFKELDNANFLLRAIYRQQGDRPQTLHYAVRGLALLDPASTGLDYDDPRLLRDGHLRTIPELNALAQLGGAIVESDASTLRDLELAYEYFLLVDRYWLERIPAANPQSALRLIGNVGTRAFSWAMDAAWSLYQATGDPQHRDAIFYFADRLRAFLLYKELILSQENEQTVHIDGELYDLRAKEADPELRLDSSDQYRRLDLLRERERYSRALQQDTSQYRQVVFSERVALERVGRETLAAGQALLQLTVSGPLLYGVYIDRDTVRVFRTPHGQAVLEHAAGLNAALANTGILYVDRARTYLRHAATLYRLILGDPLGGLPAGVSELVLIPGDNVPLFPPEALLTEPVDPRQLDPRRWPYLLHRADARLATAYKIFAFHRERRQRADYRGELGTWVSEDLREPMDEIIQAVKAYPGAGQRLFAGSACSTSSFRRHAGRFALLQCILHAEGSTESEYDSRIRFGDGDFLFAYELMDLSLEAVDLLILVACETTVGTAQPGEGNYNFVRYAQRAGVAEVLASLWKLPDRPTSELLARFHEALAAGRSPLTALGVAKRTFVVDRPAQREAFPSQWAGVVLY